MKDIDIASICHETNRAYCVTQGDHSQVAWDDAPDWQRKSAEMGVSVARQGAGPEQLHESWLAQKAADGWVYGPVKDADKKTHPCCVPYNQLPDAQKRKDALFRAIVSACS
jgi:hypothetical protein